MATPLTPVVSKHLPHLGNMQRFVYEIPSVLPSSTSPRYELDIMTSTGKIAQLRVNYDPGVGLDTDVKLYIFTSDLGARKTIDHLIETPTIDDGCFSQAGELGIYFENTDPAVANPAKGTTGIANLYVEVDNLGATNPTGTVSLELIIQAAGHV